MDSEYLKLFKDFVDILQNGGAAAAWALFVILWWMERRDNKKLVNEVRDLALAQVQNNIETRVTLNAVKEALNGVKYEQEEAKGALVDLSVKVEKIEDRQERLLLPAHHDDDEEG